MVAIVVVVERTAGRFANTDHDQHEQPVQVAHFSNFHFAVNSGAIERFHGGAVD